MGERNTITIKLGWKIINPTYDYIFQFLFSLSIHFLQGYNLSPEKEKMKHFKVLSIANTLFSFLFIVIFQLCKQYPAFSAISPFTIDPYDAVGFFAIQLAVLAAVLSLVRAFRPLSSGLDIAERIHTVTRSVTIGLLSITVTMVANLIALFRFPNQWINNPTGILVFCIIAGMLVSSLVLLYCSLKDPGTFNPEFDSINFKPILLGGILFIAIMAFFPMSWGEANIAGGLFAAFTGMAAFFLAVWAIVTGLFPKVTLSTQNIYDDLKVIAEHFAEKNKGFNFIYTLFRKTILKPNFEKLIIWFENRNHRLLFVILFGAGAGFMLLLSQFIFEGHPSSASQLIPVLAVFMTFESSSILLGYLLIGPFLEIR